MTIDIIIEVHIEGVIKIKEIIIAIEEDMITETDLIIKTDIIIIIIIEDDLKNST